MTDPVRSTGKPLGATLAASPEAETAAAAPEPLFSEDVVVPAVSSTPLSGSARLRLGSQGAQAAAVPGPGPLVSLEITGAEQHASFHLHTLDDFYPAGRTGEVDLVAAGLDSVVVQTPRLNLLGTNRLDDPNTDEHEGIRLVANYLDQDYFAIRADGTRANQHVLDAFGISDLYELTPRQAVQLAAYIPIERIDYSYAQIVDDGPNAESRLNDQLPIHLLLEWGPDGSGNGVCRNYASVAVGTLEALKLLQRPGTSRLTNTYGLEIGYTHWASPPPGFVDIHAWNGFVTFDHEQDGSITAIGTVLDSTWADGSANVDPARLGEPSSRLDYSRERAFTLARYFSADGLIPPDEYARQLLALYHREPALDSNAPFDDLAYPLRLQIGDELVRSLRDATTYPPFTAQVLAELSADLLTLADRLPANRELWGAEARAANDAARALAAMSTVNEQLIEQNPAAQDLSLPILRATQRFLDQNHFSTILPNRWRELLEHSARLQNDGLVEAVAEGIARVPRGEETVLERPERLPPSTYPTLQRVFPSFEVPAESELGFFNEAFAANNIDFDMDLDDLEEAEQRAFAERILQLVPPQTTLTRIRASDSEPMFRVSWVDVRPTMSDEEIIARVEAFKLHRSQAGRISENTSVGVSISADSAAELRRRLDAVERFFTTTSRDELGPERIVVADFDFHNATFGRGIGIDAFLGPDDSAVWATLRAYDTKNAHDPEKEQARLRTMEFNRRVVSVGQRYSALRQAESFLHADQIERGESILEGAELALEQLARDPAFEDLRRLRSAYQGENRRSMRGIELRLEALWREYQTELRALGVPYHLASALNGYGQPHMLDGGVLSPDGRVLSDDVQLSDLLWHDPALLEFVEIQLGPAPGASPEAQAARDALRKRGSPIRITRTEEGRFYSDDEQVIVRPGDRIVVPEAEPTHTVYVGGTVVLHPAAGDAGATPLLEGVERYTALTRRFREVNRSLPHRVIVRPQRASIPVTADYERRLEELASLLLAEPELIPPDRDIYFDLSDRWLDIRVVDGGEASAEVSAEALLEGLRQALVAPD